MKKLFDNKDDMFKAVKEHLARVEIIHAMPEYQEFLKYSKEIEQFSEFLKVKRLERMKPLMDSLFINKGYGKHDDTKLIAMIERVKKLEKRLSDAKWKKHTSFCSSNIMDLVWEYFVKYGREVEIQSMFGSKAYRIGDYTMETYSGQGEYGYDISRPQRIF